MQKFRLKRINEIKEIKIVSEFKYIMKFKYQKICNIINSIKKHYKNIYD